MTIIGSNRDRRSSERAHDFVSASISQALSQPSKRELQEMLAEAVRNTAAMSEKENA